MDLNIWSEENVEFMFEGITEKAAHGDRRIH